MSFELNSSFNSCQKGKTLQQQVIKESELNNWANWTCGATWQCLSKLFFVVVCQIICAAWHSPWKINFLCFAVVSLWLRFLVDVGALELIFKQMSYNCMPDGVDLTTWWMVVLAAFLAWSHCFLLVDWQLLPNCSQSEKCHSHEQQSWSPICLTIFCLFEEWDSLLAEDCIQIKSVVLHLTFPRLRNDITKNVNQHFGCEGLVALSIGQQRKF